MISRLASLPANQRGNAVVELGLIAPIIATFLVGMVDISHAVAERLQLEQAAQRAIERVMQEQESSSTYSNLAADAAASAGVSASDVTVTPSRECNGVTVATGAAYYTTTCTTGQAEAAYISVVVTKPFTPMFSTRFFPGANSNGTITLTGKAGIRIK